MMYILMINTLELNKVETINQEIIELIQNPKDMIYNFQQAD